jgi:NhaA family Na+:H+ antiporter
VSVDQRELSKSFKEFFESEKSGGFVLITCTVFSIVLANSIIGPGYLRIFRVQVGGLSVEHWINDGLMAVFFLLIGLELQRELQNGELSNFKQALLPVLAAIGGLCLPGLIHIIFNLGTPTHPGFGIPMATDIWGVECPRP